MLSEKKSLKGQSVASMQDAAMERRLRNEEDRAKKLKQDELKKVEIEQKRQELRTLRLNQKQAHQEEKLKRIQDFQLHKVQEEEDMVYFFFLILQYIFNKF